MGLYNFQRRFADPITDGSKRQTIRSYRRYPDGPGRLLHLYTGLRHPGARLLLRTPCTWTDDIYIRFDGQITVGHSYLFARDMEELARRDGFKTHREMIAFWEGKLPFWGQIIGWGQEP